VEWSFGIIEKVSGLTGGRGGARNFHAQDMRRAAAEVVSRAWKIGKIFVGGPGSCAAMPLRPQAAIRVCARGGSAREVENHRQRERGKRAQRHPSVWFK
jgi:hypothetical protein